MAGLAYHRPEDPISFLQSCLEEAKTRKGSYSWNLFISPTTASSEPGSRVLFSRNKPLPPIDTRSQLDEKQIFFVLGVCVRVCVCVSERERERERGWGYVVVAAGGPGCGKGTQCEKLVREFGLAHLSSGDLLRLEVAKGSPQGQEIQHIMEEGRLVPPVSMCVCVHALNFVSLHPAPPMCTGVVVFIFLASICI